MSVSEANGKIFRMLDLYEKLNHGDTIQKKQYAVENHVSEKTVQRDLADLNQYFATNPEEKSMILYNRDRGFSLSERNNVTLTDSDIFAFAKILLESRAFSKNEMNRLINSLLSLCSEKATVKELIKNECFYYVPPRHNRDLVDFIWNITLSIKTSSYAEVTYQRQDGKTKQRKLKPLGLVFDTYYFYLIANICGIETAHPAVFRIDRFQSYSVTQEKFTVPYKNRFEEGQYRKRIQFMYQGELIHIQFKFWGDSLEAVLDRIPTAKVIGYDGEKAILEAEVYNKGIEMWLLSQREYLEVIKPESLRESMRETIINMLENYQ